MPHPFLSIYTTAADNTHVCTVQLIYVMHLCGCVIGIIQCGLMFLINKVHFSPSPYSSSHSPSYLFYLPSSLREREKERRACACATVFMMSWLYSRFRTCAPSFTPRKQQARVKNHDKALKKVTLLKNQTWQALHKAKRQGDSTSIQSLAAKFLSLLRTHSRLKKKSSQRLHHQQAKVVRDECYCYFWRFTNRLLDDAASSQVSPTFSATCLLLLSDIGRCFLKRVHQLHET